MEKLGCEGMSASRGMIMMLFDMNTGQESGAVLLADLWPIPPNQKGSEACNYVISDVGQRSIT